MPITLYCDEHFGRPFATELLRAGAQFDLVAPSTVYPISVTVRHASHAFHPTMAPVKHIWATPAWKTPSPSGLTVTYHRWISWTQ